MVKTTMVLKDFEGNMSEVKGVLNVELTIGTKTLPTTFFVIDGKGSYSVLLRRDWIHTNYCVTSTMHQALIQCIDDQVEVVKTDRTPMLGQPINIPASRRVLSACPKRLGKESSLKLAAQESECLGR